MDLAAWLFGGALLKVVRCAIFLMEPFEKPRVKIPTRFQLCRMSESLNTADLQHLGIMDVFDLVDHRHNMSPARVLRVLEEQRGTARHQIWALAMDAKFQEPVLMFEPFMRLSAELRHLIWRHALDTHRIVEFVWRRDSREWRVTTSSCERQTGMFLACKESFDIATENFLNPWLLGTWLAPETDLICKFPLTISLAIHLGLGDGREPASCRYAEK